jgi:hypothetical protein
MRNTIEILFGAGIKAGTAVEWLKVGSSVEGGGYDTYFDPATIRSNGDTIKMWHLHDFKTMQLTEGIAYSSSKNWVEYDSVSGQRRTLYFSWNSAPMGAGEAVYRLDQPSDWRPVVPGSIAEQLLKVARGNQ